MGESLEKKQKKAAASYAWTWKDWFFFILGKVEEGRKCYDKSIELDPMNLDGLSGKLWTNFILGKVNKSLDCYEKYIEIDKRYDQSVPHRTLEPDIQHGTSSPDIIIGGRGNDIF